MPILKDIRKRINSISNTMKIMDAMKMIAISKLRGVQEGALKSRKYNDGLKELALQIAGKGGEGLSPVFTMRPKTKNVTIIVMTPERGFCGNLSEEVFNQVKSVLDFMRDRQIKTKTFVAGSKGAHHFKKHGLEFEKIDIGVEDLLAKIKVEGLCRHLLDQYLSGETDQILLAYNKFVSISSHQVALDIFLPIWVKGAEKPKIRNEIDFLYEPEKSKVIETIVMKTLKTQLYQTLLEGRASELASRMIAMNKAVKNAEDKVKSLTGWYHKTRQAAITRELLDIIGGAEALKGV